MKKIYICCFLIATLINYAQTDIDGIMMDKNYFCSGATYEYSSWKNYWEGTFKRENLNLGTVSTKKIGIMGNYGISDKLNFLFSMPYVTTAASAGTMKGQKGIQDFSMILKYMPYEKSFKNNTIAFYIIGSYSLPASNYVADYLPLSLGSRSKTGTLRLMGDYQKGDLFTTVSGAYSKRANILIDRDSYLTDEIHYTNEVDMPDAISFNARIGYRTRWLIAEAIYDSWISQKGGFDITKNNMPFPSNTMNAKKIGLNIKYTFKKMSQLSLIGGYNHVTSGRNFGQSNSVYGGIFYLLNLKKIKKDEKSK